MRALPIGIVALSISWTAYAATTDTCDPHALMKAYVELHDAERLDEGAYQKSCGGRTSATPSADAGGAAFAGLDKQCRDSIARTSAVTETESRLKLCADAGSATAAQLYANRLENTRLRNARWAENLSDDPAARAPWREMVTEAAAQTLKYYQLCYSLDATQAPCAEGVGDLLQSGDVGEGRRTEALEWYYKAGTGYAKSKQAPEMTRQQTMRILEKMTGIDRESPLTKALQSQLYN